MLNEQIGVSQTPQQNPIPSPGPFFKLVVIVAILSVIALVGAFSYYLYTVSQVGLQKPTPTTTSLPSPTIPPADGLTPTLSPSDKTQVLEGELRQTTVEDFEADFQALQEETAGL